MVTADDLNIVYEDNHIIAVVKPVNVPTQEDESKDTDMLRLIKDYLIKKYDKKGDAYVGLVHRLDRPTGGIMIFAKTSKAASRLSESIKNGEFEKKYLAVVVGEPRISTDRLTHYLKKNPSKNIVSVVPMLTEGAKFAELDYKTLEVKGGYSLVSVRLHTGRSHQIRVQMATIGHPLYGDQKYGNDERSKNKQLALWSTEVRFPHPVEGKMMMFRVYPPTDKAPWKAFNINSYLNIDINNA